MVRGRAGRARFITNDRATVREFPTRDYDPATDPLIPDPGEPEPMRTAVTIDEPEDLLRLVLEQGAEVRTKTDGNYMVKGPRGTVPIPRAWTHGRGRENVLTAVRRAGFDLTAPPERRPAPAPDEPEIPKLETTGGRPTLTMTGPMTQRPTVPARALAAAQEPPAPASQAPKQAPKPDPRPTAMPRQRAAAEGSDVEALMELLSGATERIDALETGHRKLQRRIADLERESGVGTTFTRAAKTREKIMETFRAMPAGWKLTSSTIVANLEGDEVDANAVRYQLGRLVSQGQLQVAGERASAQYSLAPLDGGS